MPPKKNNPSKIISNETKNHYESLPAHLRNSNPQPDLDKTGIVLPARICLIGSSGSGKTVCLFEFLQRSPHSFTKIVLCVKSTGEPLYQHLIESTDPELLDVFEGGIVPPLADYKCNPGAGLIIFDDLMSLSKNEQLPIVDWSIRCRKLGEFGFTMVYISQSFFAIPKNIRLQMSYLFIKKLASAKDRNLILSECSLGISKEQLDSYYKKATKRKWDFLGIALESPEECKYRRNFLEIL